MLKKSINLSIHPKFSAGIDLAVGFIFLILLYSFTLNWWLVLLWFGLRFSLWFLLSNATFYPRGIKKSLHLLSLLIFSLGVFFILIFIDWQFSRHALSIMLVAMPAVSYYLIPSQESILDFVYKPFRRWTFLMTVFGLGGLWSTVNALRMFKFFPIFNSWMILLFFSMISSFVAIWWWKEYGLGNLEKTKICALLVGLIMFELSWVLSVTPIGFLIYGFILIWVWYIVWLLFRFFICKEGIIWEKQRLFLITNIILFLLFLIFVVQWK